ncbi:MAG: glutamate racemase [Bacilli bacterium]|nr:glutamate racemase [Bacilli bacterium]
MRIGLFDSGVGGLTVLKSFIKYHPSNEYFYYGDTLNVPYGEKTIDELYSYSKRIINYLKEKKVDIIVIACGTISSNLYDRLKEEIEIPIYSVLSELPEYVKNKGYKKTLVMATNASINSHIFKRNLPSEVIEVKCPLLVPMIESNNYNGLDEVLSNYLKDKEGIDSLVLGCTHYPLIRNEIEKMLDKNVDIIDLGEILAKKIITKDSFFSLDLFFSKESENLRENVNKILNN